MEIKLVNVHKAYGQHVIFDNLSLTIPSKQMTVIYGASGCGKTTLLNMIGLVEPYQKGTITYDGVQIKSGREKRKMLRNIIGFIFQDFGLMENESIEANMNMVAKIRRLKNRSARIENSLSKVSLDLELKRKIYELSGGEQQRVAIAKTLLKNPDLILADEPTASLDEQNKTVVLELLQHFVTKGKTVIIVSHDPLVRTYGQNIIEL